MMSMSYFQDGGHDVISRRKVLPSAECTCILLDITSLVDITSFLSLVLVCGCSLAILSTVMHSTFLIVCYFDLSTSSTASEC